MTNYIKPTEQDIQKINLKSISNTISNLIETETGIKGFLIEISPLINPQGHLSFKSNDVNISDKLNIKISEDICISLVNSKFIYDKENNNEVIGQRLEFFYTVVSAMDKSILSYLGSAILDNNNTVHGFGTK